MHSNRNFDSKTSNFMQPKCVERDFCIKFKVPSFLGSKKVFLTLNKTGQDLRFLCFLRRSTKFRKVKMWFYCLVFFCGHLFGFSFLLFKTQANFVDKKQKIFKSSSLFFSNIFNFYSWMQQQNPSVFSPSPNESNSATTLINTQNNKENPFQPQMTACFLNHLCAATPDCLLFHLWTWNMHKAQQIEMILLNKKRTKN